MKTYNYRDIPFIVYGCPEFKNSGCFRRLPASVTSVLPHLDDPARKSVGFRLRFSVESSALCLCVKVSNVYSDIGMSFYQANVCNVFTVNGGKCSYLGILSATDHLNSTAVSGTFRLPAGRNDVTVYLPRNPYINDIEISVDDGAEITPAPGFSVPLPFVFYGSSITENGHTSSCNSYAALVSKWFDADYYNFGFSGMAKGEIAVCDYIRRIPASVFFYDYDHNAPTAEHLQSTHRPFFERYRELNPVTPVIMMTRPNDDTPDADLRRRIVRGTFDSALKNGDKNVYYTDGRSYFEGVDRSVCTTDATHPNDLGHYLMAKRLSAVLTGLGFKPVTEF